MRIRNATKKLAPGLAAALLAVAALSGCAPEKTAAAGGDIVTLPAGKAVDLASAAVDGKVTIFDFYADWCAPCRIVGPKLEEFAAARPDQIALRKIDVIDWESEAAVHQGIEYLPYLAIVDASGELVAAGDDSFPYLRQEYDLDLLESLLLL